MSPSLESAFSAAHLRRLAGSRSFDRGHAYADSGRVKRVEIGNQEARAAVLGSREYSVRLWLDGGERGFSCTCPLGEDQVFCKHCVALGLAAYAGTYGSAEIREPAPSVDAPNLAAPGKLRQLRSTSAPSGRRSTALWRCGTSSTTDRCTTMRAMSKR